MTGLDSYNSNMIYVSWYCDRLLQKDYKGCLICQARKLTCLC